MFYKKYKNFLPSRYIERKNKYYSEIIKRITIYILIANLFLLPISMNNFISHKKEQTYEMKNNITINNEDVILNSEKLKKIRDLVCKLNIIELTLNEDELKILANEKDIAKFIDVLKTYKIKILSIDIQEKDQVIRLSARISK
ncbi:hypothetical protein CPJCM30710_06250 [Clostridium polyendosporum]|uniref:Uncharacterized protein n=1 Tax=Clostridium polyendosporum TaxID=69208 RepID=A0A919VDG0_9CLOT|nr:hypothetical protein [Clostridium polyendosporum]GIM27959.1 hypothetical protein CPJCM30710_06250 [Clostridium polyendosporum]